MRALVGCSFVGLLLLAGCTGQDKDEDDEDENATEIEVDDDYFEPESATAKVGDTLSFENEGQRAHTVTVHRPPDAGTSYVKDTTLQPGEETSLSFDKAGTYHVFCKFHGSIGAGMHLNVTVSA